MSALDDLDSLVALIEAPDGPPAVAAEDLCSEHGIDRGECGDQIEILTTPAEMFVADAEVDVESVHSSNRQCEPSPSAAHTPRVPAQAPSSS